MNRNFQNKSGLYFDIFSQLISQLELKKSVIYELYCQNDLFTCNCTFQTPSGHIVIKSVDFLYFCGWIPCVRQADQSEEKTHFQFQIIFNVKECFQTAQLTLPVVCFHHNFCLGKATELGNGSN